MHVSKLLFVLLTMSYKCCGYHHIMFLCSVNLVLSVCMLYLLQLLHYFIAHVIAHMCIYTALPFAVVCTLLHTHMLRCYLMLGHCYHCHCPCCFFFCLMCYPCDSLVSHVALSSSNSTFCQYNEFIYDYYLRF
jgi:hypothetical protein